MAGKFEKKGFLGGVLEAFVFFVAALFLVNTFFGN
jgi:hypothetical protein